MNIIIKVSIQVRFLWTSNLWKRLILEENKLIFEKCGFPPNIIFSCFDHWILGLTTIWKVSSLRKRFWGHVWWFVMVSESCGFCGCVLYVFSCIKKRPLKLYHPNEPFILPQRTLLPNLEYRDVSKWFSHIGCQAYFLKHCQVLSEVVVFMF